MRTFLVCSKLHKLKQTPLFIIILGHLRILFVTYAFLTLKNCFNESFFSKLEIKIVLKD